MGDNIIFNDNDEAIGYYSDLVKFYKKAIKDDIDANQYDEAKQAIDELQEIDEWTDEDGLLILSENNGMGFTCKQYKGGHDE